MTAPIHHRLRFLAARGSLIVARPLAIMLTSRFASNEVANDFALLVVAVGFGLVVSAFDSGRLYYESTLAGEGPRAIRFYDYAGRVVLTGAVGAIVSAAIAAGRSLDPWLASAAAGYFLTERVIDERQRYLLVDRRINDWSSMQLSRGSMQVAFTAIALLAATRIGGLAAPWLALPLAAANLLTLNFLPAAMRVARLVRGGAIAMHIARRSAAQITGNGALWVAGLLGATLGYGDRIAIALWDSPSTASLVVTASCLSLQSVAVSTFFFTPRRDAIVRNEVPFLVFSTRAYLVPALGGFAAALALAAASLAGFAGDARSGLTETALLACVTAVTTLGGMLREVAYYRLSGSALVRTDGVTLVAAAIGVLGSWAAGAPLAVAFALLLAVQAARSIVLVRSCVPVSR
jgi:hypothetical protein